MKLGKQEFGRMYAWLLQQYYPNIQIMLAQNSDQKKVILQRETRQYQKVNNITVKVCNVAPVNNKTGVHQFSRAWRTESCTPTHHMHKTAHPIKRVHVQHARHHSESLSNRSQDRSQNKTLVCKLQHC
jgi:hypothetical protein